MKDFAIGAAVGVGLVAGAIAVHIWMSNRKDWRCSTHR